MSDIATATPPKATQRTDTRGLAFTALVICYALLILFPVFWMWSLAFKPENVMFARPTVWFFEPTLDHFRYMIENGYHHYLINSIIVAGLSTVLVVILGTPAAYAFARYRMRGRDDLFLFVLATRMAPPVCLVIPYYLVYSKIGLLDTYAGLIIAYLTFNLSFYVWVLSSFCRDLPLELEEAARADGYSRLGAFVKVLLPLLRPGITATAVLCFIFAWNEFMYAFLLGGQNVKTLPVGIPSLITTQGVRWGEMAIIGMVGTIPVMIVVFVLQKHIVRGLTMGAVKG
ncbi:Trehalose transport system permease protein SugB [Hartmannibacter diazotrophicus]|uniref:Trehalose transport system permease protein SugB n=1 Tax=Hartmannibacter diazotrophicus TaxID=1482074 RepID=A0A2C9D5U7_9HYPH|nr:carbohydrate ABC transporter permease [Hartmannibacter diazotrophicus]SON55687.1 Trehalose transport system permease protein SugB [Hartmannibacter diazotrophicus]